MVKILRLIRSQIAFFLVGSLLFISPCIFAAEDSKELTLEEISKTEAAQLYVSKQYEKAIEAFLKLEEEHPQNVLVKRYLASLYDSLRQWENAEQKLNAALALAPDDIVSHQMLGDILIKKGESEQAKEHFQAILNKAGETPSGKYAQRRLDEIEKLAQTAAVEGSGRMPPRDFMKSVPAQNFAKGKIKEALEGFDGLLQVYPEDPLIHRFRGIALLKLNRTDEAIAAFQKGVEAAPENAAMHFYLGQAYQEKPDVELARQEYQWVIQHDEGTYQMQAKRAIFQTLGGEKPAAPKRWTLNVTQGWDYDTNATYKSRDDRESQAGDQNSSRFNTTMIATYKIYQKTRWIITADALYAQSLYTDFPTLQTYTPGAGVSALYVFNFFQKPSFLNIRDGVTHTFLKNKFYVFTNTLSSTLFVNITPKLRTTLGHRFSESAYEARGSSPELTNRNGLSNAISTGLTYYFNDARTFYTNLSYEYEYANTVGLNYNKKSHYPKFDIHFPIFWKMEGEFGFRYKDAFYPEYDGASPPKRWDHQYTLISTLTRPLYKDRLNLSLSHTYEMVPAQNNAYEYYKNVFSSQVTARF